MKVQLTQCDRCDAVGGAQCAEVSVRVADGDATDYDLCSDCRGDLDAFLHGRPLRRIRKATAAAPAES